MNDTEIKTISKHLCSKSMDHIILPQEILIPMGNHLDQVLDSVEFYYFSISKSKMEGAYHTSIQFYPNSNVKDRWSDVSVRGSLEINQIEDIMSKFDIVQKSLSKRDKIYRERNENGNHKCAITMEITILKSKIDKLKSKIDKLQLNLDFLK